MMSRWQPNARGRLAEAALALYAERGYEQTTVAEIAARAGLTERTFFRYFTDKREVLFWGSDDLRAVIVAALANAPAAATPLEAVTAAVAAAGESLQERSGHEGASRRQAVVSSHAELQERELIKLASLAASIANALRQRGVKEPAASLAAEAGIAAFKVGFQRWVDEARPRELTRHIELAIAELKLIIADAPASKPKKRARSPAQR